MENTPKKPIKKIYITLFISIFLLQLIQSIVPHHWGHSKEGILVFLVLALLIGLILRLYFNKKGFTKAIKKNIKLKRASYKAGYISMMTIFWTMLVAGLLNIYFPQTLSVLETRIYLTMLVFILSIVYTIFLWYYYKHPEKAE